MLQAALWSGSMFSQTHRNRNQIGGLSSVPPIFILSLLWNSICLGRHWDIWNPSLMSFNLDVKHAVPAAMLASRMHLFQTVTEHPQVKFVTFFKLTNISNCSIHQTDFWDAVHNTLFFVFPLVAFYLMVCLGVQNTFYCFHILRSLLLYMYFRDKKID